MKNKEYFFRGSKAITLIEGKETEGRVALVQHIEKRGGEPPLHIHHEHDEVIEVQEGELTFFLGEDQFDAVAGNCVFVPKGTPHRFEVKNQEAKILVTSVPAGYDSFVQEVGTLVPSGSDQSSMPTEEDEEDIERLIKIGKKYNMSFFIDGEWK
ncbi:cupin domain-containing protein [Priestia megaterium]|jgi:mannose-6-phosphate isomerase-like protein (cupin superfamily)|uniref:cupin domain-containing protein n=1 Tax=Priestia megaterium TaxID=1404 RepID=UPI000BF3BAD9|nr:cupin domain-containing protein [Priestia megaterium]RFB19486.1 cupin domain-containing protein [Bacillus sp. ALD]MDP1442576.1 cupin domain-containing protein [Priestia megaterium]MDP1471587.1 cupin domain-containing protein [Priestia megaterium]MDR7207094.1 mannose-6-phosphate isomerase-like protein (cupin superfamily) [Priestia megaterium]MED3854304.1 cupin domain-containing protein [Priestia megaterium]